jgi:NitT/TauT family transport system ATP-binding protein
MFRMKIECMDAMAQVGHGKRKEPSADRNGLIVATGLSIAYPGGNDGGAVIADVDLSVSRGSIVALIGPSGCGKSTLLKAVAGLVAPSRGRIEIAGSKPEDAARRRQVGLVFQEANLLPWKTALENASFLLQVSDHSVKPAAARERAFENLKLVGLEAATGKLPSQLSGGMRQRVALARALTLDPQILLMDEPFGALDAITREEMNYLLLDIWERTGKTVMLVTHSIDEAVLLCSDVHVMGLKPGRIVETVSVPLPYPRNETSFSDARFQETCTALRALLLASHGREKKSAPVG